MVFRTKSCKLFQLHSNPWNCDCHLKNFRDWVVFRGLYTYPTSCAEPERLADKLWQDVDPKDFACKPDIQVPQSVVFSQPGANVTLSCFIIGNPMPDAKWVLKVHKIPLLHCVSLKKTRDFLLSTFHPLEVDFSAVSAAISALFKVGNFLVWDSNPSFLTGILLQ